MNRPKILLVEDEGSVAMLFRMFLSRLGVDIFEASNGLEAMGILKTMEPDLVITDLQMPIMDGLQLAKEIRNSQNRLIKNVSIIAISGSSDQIHKLASEVGINIVLRKPIKHAQFQQVVEAFLERK